MQTQIVWDCKRSTAKAIIDLVRSAGLDVWFTEHSAIIQSRKRTMTAWPGDCVVFCDGGRIDLVDGEEKGNGY